MKPTGITLGPDGNLWFTLRGGDGAIGRITPQGVITEYTAGLTPGGAPTDIVEGRDGNLWFTLSADPGGIGRIDPETGDITEFRNGLTTDSGPSHIVEHSNGRLYFTESSDPGAIARIKPQSGHVDEYTAGLTPNQRPTGIAEGGDGALWFTSGAAPGRIGRFWPATKGITELTGGIALNLLPGREPSGITRGPDGNIWFTQRGFPGGIGRVTVPPRVELEIEERDGASRHDEPGVLEASITANSQATTYRVEYGLTKSYGSASADLPAGAGTEPEQRELDLPLAPGGPYHARVVATNGSGPAASHDLTFWVTENGDISAYAPPAPTTTPVITPAPAAAPIPGAPALTPAAPAPPALGQGVVIRPVSGAVRFRAPGASGYTALGSGAHVPVGSLIDTRNGRVSLQSARNARGRTQTGTFWGALFQVRQRRHGRGVTDIVLRGGRFKRCGTVAGASVLAREAGGKRRVVRRLWGKDRHARFRTHGRDSVATVRGTRWVTTDRCDGTLTKVSEGKVLVRDLHRKRNVLLTAGRAYLARHRR